MLRYLIDVLVQTKRLVIRGAVRFTEKARDEMEQDNLTAEEVLEAVVNAQAISKTIKSHSPLRRHSREKRYVIKSFSYSGTLIYTKGTIVKEDDRETFYIFISSKVATFGE